MSGVLVNITSRYEANPSSGKFFRAALEDDPLVKLVKNLQAPAAPLEVLALTEAWTAFYKACGSYDLCGRCFRRELTREELKRYHDGGCCGNCAHLSDNGCVLKPVACAAWMCTNLNHLVEAHGAGTALVARRLQYTTMDYFYGFFADGFYHQRTTTATPQMLQVARVLTACVNALTVQVKARA